MGFTGKGWLFLVGLTYFIVFFLPFEKNRVSVCQEWKAYPAYTFTLNWSLEMQYGERDTKCLCISQHATNNIQYSPSLLLIVERGKYQHQDGRRGRSSADTVLF